MVEAGAAVPWSVLIAIGGALISSLAGIVVALLNSRLGRLENQLETAVNDLHAIRLESTTDRGQLLWLKASYEQRRDDSLPREIVLQRLEQQDHQLARIEASLDRKISVGAMTAVNPRDSRIDPDDLPPMRGRLPSTRGR